MSSRCSSIHSFRHLTRHVWSPGGEPEVVPGANPGGGRKIETRSCSLESNNPEDKAERNQKPLAPWTLISGLPFRWQPTCHVAWPLAHLLTACCGRIINAAGPETARALSPHYLPSPCSPRRGAQREKHWPASLKLVSGRWPTPPDSSLCAPRNGSPVPVPLRN